MDKRTYLRFRPTAPKDIDYSFVKMIMTASSGRSSIAHLKAKPKNVRERPKHNMETIDPHIPINRTGFLPIRSDNLFQGSMVIAITAECEDI